MFDWFWNFLYGITKSLFRVIDGLMACVNKLCGIEPIEVNKEEVDFLTYLLQSEQVSLAFRITAIIGVILVISFGILAIVRSIATEKGGTPAQIVVSVFKTMGMFLFVPAVMLTLVLVLNTFMIAIYSATLGGNGTVPSLGNFLVGTFSQDARLSGVPENFYLQSSFNYLSTSNVRGVVDLTDFDYIFSWIAGFCILLSLGSTFLMFVDRTISLVMLYIVAPISISTNVIDDGTRFKLWRDQVLVKFITAYGCIIAINIYILIISLISSDSVRFFNNSTYNNLLKIAFIIGGSFSLQRSMALVGNLISSGAGSNELRDNAIASAGMRGILSKAGGMAFKGGVGGVRGVATTGRGLVNFAKDAKKDGLGSTVGNRVQRLGSTLYNKLDPFGDAKQKGEAEAKKKNNMQLANMIGDRVSSAINGGGGSKSITPKLEGKAGGKKPGAALDNIISSKSSLDDSAKK